ncbi:hypothetical protein ABFS83_12G141400 [Erythranthe nasuta]
MENGRSTLGLEDGTIDVERLLVEPQEGHVSMDSVMCFNKKIPKNTTEMVDVSCRFGGSGTGSAKEGEDILNGEVLDAMPGEVDVGYLRLHDDFCSMGDEYLLGVQFAESITNLDYGSTEALQTPFPDSQMQVSGAGSGPGSACKSDRFRTMEVPDCKNNQFNYGCSELSDIHSYHECEMLIREEPSISPRSFSLQNIGKFHNSSSYSFEDILSDEHNGRQSALGEMFCSPKTENSNEVQDGETFQRQETLATTPVQANCTDILPTQKRSRKPTQRYIDELADPFSTNSKKRREVSSSTLKVKDKSLRVKDHKKCHMGTRAIRLPAEESSVMAIQVPFASLPHNECPKDHLNSKVECVNSGNLMTNPKGKRSAPENQKKRDESITAVYLKKDDYVTSHKKGDDYVKSRKKGDDYVTNRKKGDDYVTSHKKGDDFVTSRRKGDDFVTSRKKGDDFVIAAANLKKREDHAIEASQKKKNDCTDATTPKKRDKHLKHASENKRDECDTSALHEKKSENSVTDESPEEVSAFRKHHRLWTIAEVRKLIDGVSQYGVGRWSRIKKLFFATSAHRTSVDLKDKWRNLLKASGGIQEQGSQQGEKKRNMAWRPLPKSILRRVCELSAMYPYPKGQRPKKITDNNNNNYNNYNESPDRSTDITLSDYRRILRSVDDN